MTLFLISPQPECVFTFFVSFIQNVQEPNKLYFLNLPSFCSVSFIKPPEGGPRRRLVAGEKQQDSSTPPCYCCILALGKVGGSLLERGGPVTSHCPGPSLSAVCALKCWQSYFCLFLGPCPVSCCPGPSLKEGSHSSPPVGPGQGSRLAPWRAQGTPRSCWSWGSKLRPTPHRPRQGGGRS